MTKQYEKKLNSKIPKIMRESVTNTCICLMLAIGTWLTLSGGAFAATYWVSPTGASTWAKCSGGTPLSGTSACSLSTANNNAVAGDTIYLRGEHTSRPAPAGV